ncbi:MAG: PIN domain-containing protein [Burkholderiaceae bacterium]
MSGTKDTVYWDTCIFFALLKKEQHKQGEYESILKSSIAFDNGNLVIVTSAITITELMAGKIDQEQKVRFRKMMTRSNFLVVDANDTVCNLASEIREYFYNNRVDELFPTTPDAIHVASAILTQVSTMVSFDQNNKRGQKELAMNKMLIDGKVMGKYPLNIRRPAVGDQNELQLSAPNQAEFSPEEGDDWPRE